RTEVSNETARSWVGATDPVPHSQPYNSSSRSGNSYLDAKSVECARLAARTRDGVRDVEGECEVGTGAATRCLVELSCSWIHRVRVGGRSPATSSGHIGPRRAVVVVRLLGDGVVVELTLHRAARRG